MWTFPSLAVFAAPQAQCSICSCVCEYLQDIWYWHRKLPLDTEPIARLVFRKDEHQHKAQTKKLFVVYDQHMFIRVFISLASHLLCQIYICQQFQGFIHWKSVSSFWTLRASCYGKASLTWFGNTSSVHMYHARVDMNNWSGTVVMVYCVALSLLHCCWRSAAFGRTIEDPENDHPAADCWPDRAHGPT